MGNSILIVDDSATMRRQLGSLLAQNGYIIVEADSGAAALAELKARPIDLVIADINMPGMSGIELTAAVRKLDAHEKTPIFVLTTEATSNVAQKGREAGATAWIVKPFKPEVLLQGVRKVLSG